MWTQVYWTRLLGIRQSEASKSTGVRRQLSRNSWAVYTYKQVLGAIEEVLAKRLMWQVQVLLQFRS